MRSITLLIALLFCTLFSFAQESYTIKMQVRMEGLPPEYAAYGEQEITTYLKGQKSKTEISSVMYSSVVYFDGDSLTMVNDMMGNRSGFTASKAQLEASSEKGSSSKPNITYTNEKKTIAGYECSKAVIIPTSEDKAGTRIVAWVTEKIKADATARRANRGMQDLGDLKGFPLEMEVEAQQQGKDVKLIMTTKEVLTTEIPDLAFKAETDGVKILPYKEWQEMMKAKGGK
jgi:hypothetical protein